MRLATVSILFLGSAIAGCAIDSTPQTSEVESAVTGKDTEHWDATKNDPNDIWPETTPNGTPITSTYVLIKGAPDDANGNPQFFGFVVWNGNNVGHIWRVKQGNDGLNFRNLWNSTVTAQTNGAPDHMGGGAGNVDASPPPPRPYPTGDGEYIITTAELNNAKTNAQAIHNALVSFTSYAF